MGKTSKACILLFVLACGSIMSAQMPVVFAKSGRLLTIESWGRREATVWAVLKDEIVIYRQFDQVNRADELVFKGPLKKDQAEEIRAAIAAIPKETYGFVHDGSFSAHPPLLRFHFTSDAAWVDRRIELSGYIPTWAKPVLDAVSKICPPEWHVDFEKHVQEYLRFIEAEDRAPDVRKISIRKYYGESNP